MREMLAEEFSKIGWSSRCCAVRAKTLDIPVSFRDDSLNIIERLEKGETERKVNSKEGEETKWLRQSK